jgi:hypothetical protein
LSSNYTQTNTRSSAIAPNSSLSPTAEKKQAWYRIRFNGDDDDNDGMADYRDNNGVAGEDDLVRIDLQFGVQQPPAGIDYYLKRSAGVLQVWTGPAKPGNGLFGNNVNEVKVNFGQGGTATLWVEWIGDQQQPVNAVLTFEARNANGQVVGQSDSLTFYRFQTTVIVIGGFGQELRFGDNQGANRGQGIFAVGSEMYREMGYDVLMFAESEQEPGIGNDSLRGRGLAYREVVEAISKRQVRHVVAIGFSYGGGAVYNLLWRLQQLYFGNLEPFGENPLGYGYSVPYSAYVDAIVHGSNTAQAETRLPVPSNYHVNIYQRIDNTRYAHSSAG